MDAQKNQSIAFKWFEAFNAKNIEQLIGLYDENAEHYSPKLILKKPETKGLIVGKEALKQWWLEAFTTMPSLHYKVTSITANNDRVFSEYIRSVDKQENMLVAEVLEIKEGKIIFSRVYHG